MFPIVQGFRWANPGAALLIMPVIVFMIWRWRRRAPSLRFSTAAAVPKQSFGIWAARLPWLLEGLAALCLVLALTRPQRGVEASRRRPRGVDIVIALDVSGSMDAIDLPRRSRDQAEVAAWLQGLDDEGERREYAARKLVDLLNKSSFPSRIDAAKQRISQFIDRRPNDRIGIIVFAGNAFTLCPPTLDHEFLKYRLLELRSGILHDTTTSLAPPITAAINRLRDADSERRVMLLFTDGEDLRPGRLTPLEAAQMAAGFKITIHTIGIGSEYGFVPQPTIFGTNTYARIEHFNPQLLLKIAEATEGQHFMAEDDAALGAIMDWIDTRIEKTPREAPQYTDFAELYAYPAIAGLVILLAGFILQQTILKPSP